MVAARVGFGFWRAFMVAVRVCLGGGWSGEWFVYMV